MAQLIWLRAGRNPIRLTPPVAVAVDGVPSAGGFAAGLVLAVTGEGEPDRYTSRISDRSAFHLVASLQSRSRSSGVALLVAATQ